MRDDVEQEIRFHLEMRVQSLMQEGLTREEAEAEAARRFGERAQLISASRLRQKRHSRREAVASMFHDVAFAVRQIRRAPLLATVIVLTMALGIGITAAMIAVVDAALLRPLPYTAPDRLVHVWESKGGDVSAVSEASYPDFLDFRTGSDAFAAIEGYDPTNVTVRDGTGAVMVQGARVTQGLLPMLGVTPSLGRFFVARDGVGDAAFVVLDHGFWRRWFGGDRSVVGRTLTINGRAHEIIGVLPRGFHFVPAGDADVWLPLGRSQDDLADRSNRWLSMVARMRDGTSIHQARASLGAVMQGLAERFPATNGGRGILVVPLREEIVGEVRPVLVLLLCSVAMLLVIACANLASLLLAHGLARTREVAVRVALGAGRARIIRQFVTESLVLAVAGGALAIWVAHGCVALLIDWAPELLFERMPYLRAASVDATVLMSAGAIAVATGVAFGLLPAVHAARPGFGALLGPGGRTSTTRLRLRHLVVSSQIALTTVLLIGAGLLTQSLRALLRTDAGFNADNVMTMRVSLSGPRYDSSESQQLFFERLLTEVAALTGVSEVGAVSHLPLNGGGTNTFRVEGQPEPRASARPEAVRRGVAGAYFITLGIRLIAGRYPGERDRADTPPAVAINESLARGLFHGGSAIGQRLRFYAFPDTTWTIVGVVADVKTGRLDEPPPPTVYISHLQVAENRMSLAVRGSAESSAIVAAVRERVRALEPDAAVYAVSSMRAQIAVSRAVFSRRYPLVLIGAFACAALILAAIGLYGVIAYTVSSRTRELGVRTALGARPLDVTALVLRDGLSLTLSGVAVGTLAAALGARMISSLLFGVRAFDPLTYGTVVLVLVGTAILASCAPAWRASHVDPLIALRSD